MTLIKVKSRGTDNVAGRRNLIINGAMRVAQRGTSSASGGYHTVDRWRNAMSTGEFAFTQAQVTDVPSGQGYSNSFKFTVTTPETSLDGSDYVAMYHAVEAQDLQTLCYGTSSAKTTTLSFWVKSSITGTYAISIYGHDATRHIVPTYTISSANTWEKKIIQIPGDTSGTINNDNGTGWQFYWLLGSGSTYTSGSGANSAWAAYSNGNFAKGHTTDWAETNGATFFLTGVQLEVGDSASDFEHRSFAEELQLCQRYCQLIKTNDGILNYNGHVNASAGSYILVPLIVPMRTAPTGITVTNVGSWGHVVYGSLNRGCNSITFGTASSKTISLDVNDASGGFTVGQGSMLYDAGADGVIEFTGAEI